MNGKIIKFTKFWLESLQEENHSEDQCAGGRIIKMNLRKTEW
jgi:hypothetical protein